MTTILVGTDTTAAADLAVEDAARLARERGASLLVLYVRPQAEIRSVIDPGKAADPERHLRTLRSRFPDLDPEWRIESGDPAEALCAVADEVRASVIVVGNRGTHESRWKVKESVPNLVLRHAPCSVYIVDTRRAQ